MNAFIRILGFCLSLLLFSFSPVLSQNNLVVKLTESSVLLDKLVVCGDIDFQTVIISIDGNSTATRSNVVATLQLFDGIIFDQLDSAASTPGIRLLEGASLNQARFSIPDMNPDALSEVEIAFFVRADCDIVAAINANNELQVFDTWVLDYTLNGTSFSETNTGVEYKNTIAIPNLSIGIQTISAPVSLGSPFEREIRIINSGLNSYLDEFAYQIIPEPGIQYQSLFIGELSLPFSKTLNSDGDTVLIALIDNDFFFNNTVESGLPGDGDGRFDVDEVVRITETLIITDCGQDDNFNLNTSHEVSWGCRGDICQKEQMTAALNLGIGEEQIQFTVGKDSINPSYCSEGTTSLFVANNGFEFDAGFGTILDVAIGIGFANGERFTLEEQGYQITSLQIGETIVFFPDTLTNLNTNDFFREDPDGEGGLEDIDQDGFFDDLAVGNSFTATATYQIDCSSGTAFDLLSACDNDFRGDFDGRMRYSNSCGVATEKNIDNYFRSFNAGGTKEICADPDALNDADQFAIVYSGERRQSNFAACNGADELKVLLTLPEGIELATTTFLEQDSLSFNPSIQQNAEEWTLTFDASTLNLNNDYNLNLLFNTQCAAVGFTSFPMQIEYYCPECDCGQIWYCGVLEGTLLHASGPPCTESSCDIGITVDNFEVERTTFGYTDAAFTTPFDPAAANKAIALSCDSVLMRVETTIGEQSLSDSIGLIISYGNTDGSTSNNTSFLFSKADISIISINGDITKCTINEDQLVIDTSNSTKQMFFDLSVCLEGRRLLEGEKIEFLGYFSVNPEAPVPTNDFKKIPEFRAKAYSIVDGVTYDNCESFGQIFRLAKLDTKFSGPNNNSYPEGCEAASMIYSLDKSINANAMRTFFGEEHRQAAKLNNLQITYDPAILTAFTDLAVSYRTLDNEWLPLADFFQFPAGTYETTFENIANISTITGSNQLFQLKIDAIPTCATAFSSTDGTAAYDISATLEYDNRYYANFIDTGSCVEQKMEVENRTILYEQAPTFSLEGIEQNVVTSATQTQWLIKHCNTSFNADAGMTWIALDVPTDSITIIAIDLVGQDGSISLLPFQEYGTGNKVFAIAPGLSKNIDGSSNDEVCNTYRIIADLAICGRQSIDAALGWNCTDFDDDNWTPDLYEPCEEQTIALSVATLSPFLSADYLAESSNISNFLCDTSIIDIVLRNEDRGRAYDINSQIIIPAGARLVPSSIAFAYPSSNAFTTIPTEPIRVEENAASGMVYQYADFSLLNAYLHENGLPGFNVASPDSSEFRLRYRLVSDCNFEDGSLNRYRFQGASACGAATNIAFAETPPFIFQMEPTVARKFDVALINQEPITNGLPTTIELEINNIGKNPSTVDSINLVLPAAITYVPNSTLALALLDWDLEEPRLIDNDSIQQIRFPLPIGLRNQESVTLSFDVIATEVDCAIPIEATISTISTVDFFCPVNNTNCLIDFSSSDSTQFLFDCGMADPCLATSQNVSDTLVIPSCETSISYCFPLLSIEERSDFILTDNGNAIDLNNASTCNLQQICIYSYGNIVNVAGPIQVLMWEVDGQNFTGTAPDIASLVDSMNVWDPTGNWVINSSSVVIEGGHEGGAYSPMQVLLPTTNIQSVLGYDARVTPRGTAVELTSGNHELVLEYPDGCTDSLSILVLEQDCETCNPATIQSIITENTSCNQSNGRIQINVSGDLANYDFEWSPDAGVSDSRPNIRSGLFTGGYRVKIMNRAEDCFIEELIVVQNENGPSLDNATATISSCNTGTGTATLSPENYTYNWSDGGSGATRIDLQVGTYYVTFTDPNNPGCPNVKLVEILDNNTLSATLDVIEFPGCNDNTGVVSIVMAGGSGNYEYSFLSGTNTQDGLSNGTYQVMIRDIDTGCELPYTFFLESRETIETMTLIGTSNVSCVGANDGQVSVGIQYSSDFLFPVDTLITDGINQYVNGQLPAGDYFVYIKDVTGCVTASLPFSITAPIPQEVAVSKTIDCEAGAAIQIAVLDSNDIQSYDWLDIPGSDNEQNRTDLISGTYELVITDNRTCTTSLAIEVEACCIPPTIEDVIAVDAACEEATGSVEILLASPTDYTYTFTPDVGTTGDNSNIRQALPAGAYEVVVAFKGDTTCSETIVVFVEETACCIEPSIEDAIAIEAICGEATGSVEILLASPTDYTYTYTPSLGTVGDDPNTRQGLPAGAYEVVIAYKGDTTCSETIVVFVEETACCIEPTIEDAIALESICEEATGSIEIVLAEPINDYTYTFAPDVGTVGTSPNIRQALPAGGYEVTVAYKGDTLCSETIVVFVEETACCIEPTIEDAIALESICEEATGSVEIVLAEPINDYTYTYDPDIGTVGTSPNIRQALPAGAYEVTIAYKGDTICSETLVVFVEETACCTSPVMVQTTVTNADCETATGSIEVLLEQPIVDYDFIYSPNEGVTGDSPNIRQELPAGAYEIKIVLLTDTTCSETIQAIVEENACCISPTIVEAVSTNAACGQATGSVEILLEQAIDGYTFTYSPAVGIVGASANIQQQLPAGPYEVLIAYQGDTTCSETISVLVEEDSLQNIITSQITAASCGSSDGIVRLTVLGASGEYTFSYTSGAGEVGATPNMQQNLPAGEYEVVVGFNGSETCTQTVMVTIPEENRGAIIRDTIINAAACGEDNGQVEIVVAGDIDNYNYLFTPNVGAVGAAANSRQNLPAGEYEITVAIPDSEECTETIMITIPNEELGDIITDTIITNADCGTDNGQIEVLVLGNPADYTYTLEPNNGREGATPNIIENLAEGIYNLTVRLDGNDNCAQNITFDIFNATLTELITDTTIIAAACGMENGQIVFDVPFDLSDYIITYEPNLGTPGDALNIRQNLPAGEYTATINYKGNADCTQQVNFTIPGEAIANIVLNTITLPSDCGVSNGTATLIVDGAVSAYSYIWPEEIGEAGDTPNIRNSLATGTYTVLVAPIDSPTCTQEVVVEIPLGNTTTSPIISDAVVNPSCGETDGMVTLTLADPIENYLIEWVPDIGVFGASENIRTNLPGGNYQILVTDKRDTICVSRVTLSLTNEMPTTNVVSVAATCQEAADGVIRLSPDNYVYTWEDGFIGSERDTLLAADYAITITDTTATDICQSTLTVTVSVDNTLSATATINSQPTCAGNDGDVRIVVQGFGEAFNFSWESESANDTTLAAGIYTVTVTNASTGCTTTVAFDLIDPTIAGLCDSIDCELKVGRDTIIMQTDDCMEIASICLDYTIDNDNPLLLSVDGFATPVGNVDPCRFDSIGIYTYSTLFGQGEIGPYEITAWPVNDTIFTGTFNTILDLVDSMNVWDPVGNWTISDEGQFIIGDIARNIYQPMQVLATNVGATATLGYNARNDASGISTFVEMGLHEIILTDPATSCSDSLIVIVACVFTDTTGIRITPNQSDTTCFSSEDLLGDIESITVDCLQNETAQVEVFGDSCVIITGQNPGADTACVVICDVFGVCDTNIVAIQILLSEYFDSVKIGSSETVCIDAGGLAINGPIDSIAMLDQMDANAPSISYEIDPFTNCITYGADALGIDTTFFAFCDAMGACDTIPFIFNVFNDAPDRVEDTLFINETITYCFDQNIFTGALTTFENICPESSGQFVDFFLDPLTFCVEYSGVALGRDSACVVLCDNLGNCDTAFFDVLVVEFKELPVAVNDLDTTTLGTPIVIDILSNDTPFGVPDDGISIIKAPLYGDADLNLDGSITYTSDEFCERTDQFVYAICNDIGCDTATVEVWIECIDIVIFSAVSPNRDDINDVFYISGIEEFPQSRLQIFNRWGERVFDKINYDNTWSGTWKGNRELPDGAYFYCLELNDDEKRVFQGFLEIHR